MLLFSQVTKFGCEWIAQESMQQEQNTTACCRNTDNKTWQECLCACEVSVPCPVYKYSLLTLTTERHYQVGPYRAPHPPSRLRSGLPVRAHQPHVSSSARCLSSSLALPALNTESLPHEAGSWHTQGFLHTASPPAADLWESNNDDTWHFSSCECLIFILELPDVHKYLLT